MKIAVSASGDSLDSMVDMRFGRCPYFIIVETEGTGKRGEIKSSETVENTGIQAMRGAGITAAQIVANKGVKVVITGNMGPNAFNVLSQSGIKIFTGVYGVTVKAAVQSYLKGELRETKAPSVPGFGPGRGMGRGRGMGTGRGAGGVDRRGMGPGAPIV